MGAPLAPSVQAKMGAPVAPGVLGAPVATMGAPIEGLGGVHGQEAAAGQEGQEEGVQEESGRDLSPPLSREWLVDAAASLVPLHPTPYTLHPTPYTLHPSPNTLSLLLSLGSGWSTRLRPW